MRTRQKQKRQRSHECLEDHVAKCEALDELHKVARAITSYETPLLNRNLRGGEGGGGRIQ
jgi:hypothetical protein